MYKYSPMRKNNLAPALAGIAFVGAIVLFALPLEKYRGLLQLAALLLATVGIFITVNNLLVSYLYRLEWDAQNPRLYTLTVTRIQGKKITTVCRLSSSDIQSVEKHDRKKPRRKGVRRYNYCVDMLADAYLLLVRDGGDDAEVLIMPDETMLSIMGKSGDQ